MCKMKNLIKRALLAFLLAVSFSCSSSARDIEVFFTPSYRALDAIVEQINKARNSIDVAVYDFTSRPLARAIVAAKKRGVKIRIILDRSANDPYKNRYTKYIFLKQNHISVRFARAHRHWNRDGLMHNKFAIIDDKTVITGSANWTASAFVINDENVLIINRKDIANVYEKEFSKLWKDSKRK